MLDVAGPLHPRTRDALEAVRRAEEKAIVLLNRRGWSNFLSCQVCGRVWKCPQCDVSLVLHRAAGAGRLPPLRPPRARCRARARTAARRPSRGTGSGTERLERELEELMEPLPVIPARRRRREGRGDAAALRRRAGRRAGRHADGRQGARLPRRHARRGGGRRLDAALSRLPRRGAHVRARRAARRPQRARAARREGDRADARTRRPTACATRPRTTPSAFLDEELARRRLLAYPPFATLIRVVCSSEEPGPEVEAAEAVRARIEGVPVLGPAPLFRLKGRERAQLVVKAAERAPAVRAVRQAVEAVAADAQPPRRQLRSRRGSAVAGGARLRFVADEHVDAEVEELEEVPQLDPEAAARRAAAMSFIRKWGDPVLKSRATPVDRFDETLLAAGPANGGHHARRDRRRAGGAAARRSRSGCSSTASAATRR